MTAIASDDDHKIKHIPIADNVNSDRNKLLNVKLGWKMLNRNLN